MANSNDESYSFFIQAQLSYPVVYVDVSMQKQNP